MSGLSGESTSAVPMPSMDSAREARTSAADLTSRPPPGLPSTRTPPGRLAPGDPGEVDHGADDHGGDAANTTEAMTPKHSVRQFRGAPSEPRVPRDGTALSNRWLDGSIARPIGIAVATLDIHRAPAGREAAREAGSKK